MTAPTSSHKVLLLPEDDDETPSPSREKQDPKLLAGIDKYLKEKERQSSNKGRPGVAIQQQQAKELVDDQQHEEEHTGITDDDDDQEEDYETVGRGTLKAGSEALVEVMEEVKRMMASEAEAETKAKTAAKKPAAGK